MKNAIVALLCCLPLAACNFGKQTVYTVQTLTCNNTLDSSAKETNYFSSFKEAEKRASAMKISCEHVALSQVVSDGGEISTYQFFDWQRPSFITFTTK